MLSQIKDHYLSLIQKNKQKRLAKFYKNSIAFKSTEPPADPVVPAQMDFHIRPSSTVHSMSIIQPPTIQEEEVDLNALVNRTGQMNLHIQPSSTVHSMSIIQPPSVQEEEVDLNTPINRTGQMNLHIQPSSTVHSMSIIQPPSIHEEEVDLNALVNCTGQMNLHIHPSNVFNNVTDNFYPLSAYIDEPELYSIETNTWQMQLNVFSPGTKYDYKLFHNLIQPLPKQTNEFGIDAFDISAGQMNLNIHPSSIVRLLQQSPIQSYKISSNINNNYNQQMNFNICSAEHINTCNMFHHLSTQNAEYNIYNHESMNFSLHPSGTIHGGDMLHHLSTHTMEPSHNEQLLFIIRNLVSPTDISKNHISISKDLVHNIPYFTFIDSSNDIPETTLFSFVISSYNNEDNILNNLLSIIYQTYTNWHIYYTNDGSTDSTGVLFWEIVNQMHIEDKVTYIANKQNMKQAYCKYNMYQLIKRDSIVVILDGDDWLSSSNVLNRLNYIYTNTPALMVYSGYKMYHSGTIEMIVSAHSYPSICKNTCSYRSYPNWLFSHLRTGHATLFKMVPKSYLIKDGQWIDRCTDMAELYCVAELAKQHVYAIRDLMCIYNKTNSLKYTNSYHVDHSTDTRKDMELFVKSCKPLYIEIPPIYVISLPCNIRSREHITAILNDNHLSNFNIFDAHYAVNEPDTVKLYNQYCEDYDSYSGKQNKRLTIGALGIIISTLQLYEHINKHTELDHVMILEEDVYIKNNFHNFFHITNADLANTDFIYIGHNSTDKVLLKLRQYDTNIITLNHRIFKNIKIYGAYAYICNRKMRNYVLSVGIEYFLKYSLPIDCLFITCYFYNKGLNMKLFNDHLFIPEVRKNGIQEKRDMSFYLDREIDISNYAFPEVPIEQ